jgi:hypothetical protein
MSSRFKSCTATDAEESDCTGNVQHSAHSQQLSSPESKMKKRQSCTEVKVQKPCCMTIGIDMFNRSTDAPCNNNFKARVSCVDGHLVAFAAVFKPTN